MSGSRLVINGVNADINEDIPIPFNFSIGDYKNPETRKRSFSKTIKLQGTAQNRRIFKNVFSLTMSEVLNNNGLTFNTTARVPAQYFRNGIQVFSGLIQLLDVEILNDEVSFNCIMLSSFIDLFSEVKDIKIGELGWSEYDHNLTKTNIENSWDTSVIKDGVATINFTGVNPDGFGYLYPLIDWGFTDNTKKYKTNELIPCVYFKEVIDKIFELTGYSYNSNFFDSTQFKRYILGYEGGEKQNSTQAERDAVKVDYTIDPDDFVTSKPCYNKGYEEPTVLLGGDRTFSYTDANANVTVTTDPAAQVDDDGLITVYKGGKFSINVSSTDLNITFPEAGYDYTNVDALDVTFVMSLVVYVNGVSKYKESITQSHNGTSGSTSMSFDFDKSYSTILNAGDTVEVKMGYTWDGALTWGGDWEDRPTQVTATLTERNIDVTMTNVDYDVVDGNVMNIDKYLPDMTCSDFLKGVMDMFNLYFSEPDANNELKVEPLDDFYKTTANFDDWTEKLDKNKPIKVIPASTKIKGKTFMFDWATENDYYNKVYRDQYAHNYGSYSIDVQDSYAQGVKKYTLPFAQSVPVAIAGDNTFVLPRIINYNSSSGAVTPYRGKARVFYYIGLEDTDTTWKLTTSTSPFTPTNKTQYPLVSHVDDIDNADIDMNFGYPKQLWWQPSTYTTDNLFKYHEKSMKESTSADAKFIRAYFKFTPSDIYNLDFSQNIMINGALFRLNEIKNYDPTKEQSTEVELIRILEGRSINKVKGGTDTGNNPSALGEGNYVPSGALSGALDSQLIGVDYDAVPAPKSSEIILINADGSNLDIELPIPVRSTQVIIKKKDPVPRLVNITAPTGVQIDNRDSISIRLEGESVTLISDGDNYWII